MQAELEMSGFSAAAIEAAKKQQRTRGVFFENWAACLQYMLAGVTSAVGETTPVLVPEKRRSLVNAIVRAEGFQVCP